MLSSGITHVNDGYWWLNLSGGIRHHLHRGGLQLLSSLLTGTVRPSTLRRRGATGGGLPALQPGLERVAGRATGETPAFLNAGLINDPSPACMGGIMLVRLMTLPDRDTGWFKCWRSLG